MQNQRYGSYMLCQGELAFSRRRIGVKAWYGEMYFGMYFEVIFMFEMRRGLFNLPVLASTCRINITDARRLTSWIDFSLVCLGFI